MKKQLSKSIALIVLMLAALFATRASAQYVRIDNDTRAYIEDRISTAISDSVFVGGSVGIVKNGEIVYLEGFGYADRENQVPADECTLFRIGSVSKTFTSILALQLWEDGKLNLHQEVSEIVMEYPYNPNRPVTPHLLMTHRAGLDEVTTLDANYWLDNPSHNAIAAVELFANDPPEGFFYPLAPDLAKYSNEGYNLMAGVVQTIAGQPYEQMVYDRIFRPMEMPRAQAEYLWRYNSNQSKYYWVSNSGGAGWHTGRSLSDRGEYIEHLPSGGFVASAVDLSLFAIGMGDGSYLSQTAIDSMTRTLSQPGNRGNHGYAMYNDTIRGNVFYFTGGGIDGGSSIIVFSDDFQDAVIINANAINSFYPVLKPLAFYLIERMNSIIVSPGNAYLTGPMPETTYDITTDKTTLYNKVAHNITVNSTMTNTSIVRLEGKVITLLPGFVAESGADFLAHSGNPNEDCMEQLGGIQFKTEPVVSHEQVKLQLYPNPSAGEVNISGAKSNAEISIFDLFGRILLSVSADETGYAQLGLAHLSSGVYFARIQTGEQQTETIRFMLNPR